MANTYTMLLLNKSIKGYSFKNVCEQINNMFVEAGHKNIRVANGWDRYEDGFYVTPDSFWSPFMIEFDRSMNEDFRKEFLKWLDTSEYFYEGQAMVLIDDSCKEFSIMDTK